MFYKYSVCYANGTKLSGYAESDKPEIEVKRGIRKKFYGDFVLTVKKHGTEFPRINSDYIMTI